jgi:Outer membrane protein beta-barrel family/Carboxypeptidase regulatory-like domain
MLKLIVVLLLTVVFPGIGFAQSPAQPPAQSTAPSFARILGTISDTTENKSLPNSSILLLRKSDSLLIRHTRADKAGHFTLKGIPPGHYLLMSTYPSYADYVDELEVTDSTTLQLPPIGMVLKSKLLEAVVVSSNKGAIHIKGDTTEFNADSFHTQAGATVEELLKKLPGIQVDKNGQITAEGQTVKKVLVDGEEFFGDDPTLVTQNLRADMIDKVQVYDKKSDQADFTGIDDGQKSKTINLKLKDGKKNGYFGRLTAGTGTDGYYDAQVMANYFKNKMKLAAYGIASNTGKTGLNWGERDNYGQSIAGSIDVDEATGDMSLNIVQDDLDSWSGQFQGQGFPTVKTGGLHYNNKWDDDHQIANGNYKYMDLGIIGTSNTNSQYILPDTFYYNNQRQTFNNQIIRHSFNGSFETKFDSSASLKFMADGGTDHKITNNAYHSEALASDSSLVNENDRTITTVGDVQTLNSNLLWRKKLAKKGRTLSFNVRENFTNNSSSGYLKSNTQLFSGGVPSSDSLIDQFKTFHTQNTLLDSKLTYTEPLSKVSFLIANAGAAVDNSHSDRNSFNKSANGKYATLDSLYSNDYQFNVLTEKGGLAYSFVKKKVRFNAGSDVGFTSFNQRDLVADTSVRRHFVNWYPGASLGYSFTNQSRLNISYSGYTTQPTVAQIQPILTNEDPLNITIGNPGLRPQFDNRFNASFNDYKVFTERGIWMNLGYTSTLNAISNSVNVDTSGKRVSQYINVNGNYSLYLNMDYNRKLKGLDMNIGGFTNITQNKNVSVVDNLPNATRSGTYTGGLSFNKSKEKKYELYIRPSASYTTSQSTINTGITTHYWTYQMSGQADVFLPWHVQVHADADITLRQKTPVFTTNNNVVLLNAWIGKKLLKKDALLLKAAANDLLNQNIGLSRTVNSNFITQNTYSTIKRYFLFSVVWNFAKTGSAPAAGGIIIN